MAGGITLTRHIMTKSATAIPVADLALIMERIELIAKRITRQLAAAGLTGEVGYTGAEIPLTVDGTYGRNTQQAAASFQAWVNATGQGSLTIDGLAGSQTQAHLADFAPMSAGGY